MQTLSSLGNLIRCFCVKPLVLTIVLAAPAQADSVDYFSLSLEELGQMEISIATGNNTPLDRAPATASVVTAAEIKALGARTLDDVLEGIPGLHVGVSNVNRMESIYSIRGIHTGYNPQVLLLLNGVPVQYSMHGSRPSLFRLPAEFVARVEVIRGPGSAIYGADAYAGVINVITKDASDVGRLELGARGGSFDTRDMWLQTAGSLGAFSTVLSFSYQESAGDDSRWVESDLQSLFDTLFASDASLAPGPLATRYQIFDSHFSANSDHWQMNLWSWISDDAGLGAGGAQALDLNGGDESSLYMADVRYHTEDALPDWEFDVRGSYLYYDLESTFNLFPAGAVLPIGGDGNLDFSSSNFVNFTEGYIGRPGAQTDDYHLNAVAFYHGWEGFTTRIAVGGRWQYLEARERKNFGPGVIDGTEGGVDGTLVNVTGTEYVFIPNSSRTTRYLSLQEQVRLTDSTELTAGLRYDDYSDFGSTVNPRLAFVWAASDWLTAKLLYGSAFRAPSFSEQFYQNNPVALGNAELDPEKIDTYEVSFNLRLHSDVTATLNIFRYRAQDLIELVPDTGTASLTARNARKQTGRGLEWELDWQPATVFRLGMNYSLQQSEDVETETDIADAPGQQAGLFLRWEFLPQWYWHSQLYWIADRARAPGDAREEIDDYLLANINLRRDDLLPRLDVALALRNAFDEDIREPSNGFLPNDYPMPGRSLMLELHYQLE